MAQSALKKRRPLVIEALWEKPSSNPTLKWENWQKKAKLAILAKENIILDILLDPKPENVWLHLELVYESTKTVPSDQWERQRLPRNVQLYMYWEHLCQRQLEIGIMCGGKPLNEAERKIVSMFYFSLGTEGRRIVCSRNLHLMWIYCRLWRSGKSWRTLSFNHEILLLTGTSFLQQNNQRNWQIKGIIWKLRTCKPRRYINKRPFYCQHARYWNSDGVI